MGATVLAEAEWQARRAAHEARVDAWIGPVLDRARKGETHPVADFLFTYYSRRPAQLRRWSPGPDVVLAGADPAELPGALWVAAEGGATLERPPGRIGSTAQWIVSLLAATGGRAAQFGCFGLHEWAMVHRQPADAVRHNTWPLRLGTEGTDRVVESLPMRCSHHDAFRFFTPSARPLNQLQPARQDQIELEQAGCLHANMDLYKWSYKLSPWVPAELVADCFELARRIRTLDMRASPYDLRRLGYEPVRIETAEGRAEYAAAQRAFAAEAAPLRERLLAAAKQVAQD